MSEVKTIGDVSALIAAADEEVANWKDHLRQSRNAEASANVGVASHAAHARQLRAVLAAWEADRATWEAAQAEAAADVLTLDVTSDGVDLSAIRSSWTLRMVNGAEVEFVTTTPAPSPAPLPPIAELAPCSIDGQPVTTTREQEGGQYAWVASVEWPPGSGDLVSVWGATVDDARQSLIRSLPERPPPIAETAPGPADFGRLFTGDSAPTAENERHAVCDYLRKRARRETEAGRHRVAWAIESLTMAVSAGHHRRKPEVKS